MGGLGLGDLEFGDPGFVVCGLSLSGMTVARVLGTGLGHKDWCFSQCCLCILPKTTMSRCQMLEGFWQVPSSAKYHMQNEQIPCAVIRITTMKRYTTYIHTHTHTHTPYSPCFGDGLAGGCRIRFMTQEGFGPTQGSHTLHSLR